jgi:uncharacterized protein (TIGR00661 family)
MNIIYGVCSWGLGHSTRSLPVIRKLIEEGNDLTIISNGRSLQLLKREIREAHFIDIPDYPVLVSDSAKKFMAKSVIYFPLFVKRMEYGLYQLSRMLRKKKYDLIISDARYDMYNKKIPTFFISHQMRIMNPLRIKMVEYGSELFNLFFFKRFKEVIVPDFREDDLSGDLSHNLKKIDEDKLHYVGILSDFKKKRKKKDIDFLISISGPEPQRSILERKLLAQAENLDGKVVMTLGKTEGYFERNIEDLTIYSFLKKEEREDLLNRAKMVISRSGYSTIMDLGVIGTKGLLIPTPGQIEQEYLAHYHRELNTFYSVDQEKVDLRRDVKIAERSTGIRRRCKVERAVENIMNVIMA